MAKKKGKKSLVGTSISAACPAEDQEPLVTNGNTIYEEQPCSPPEEVPELSPETDKATSSSAENNKPVHCPYSGPTATLICSIISTAAVKVPRALLPPSIEAKCADRDGDTIAKLDLVDKDVAYTLAHYIHTGTYQTLRLADDISAADGAAKEHYRALLAYVAATAYNLPELADLAKEEAERQRAAVPPGRALRNVENACMDLPTGDGWVREHLEKIILEEDLSCVSCDEFDSRFAGALVATIVNIFAELKQEVNRWEQLKKSIEGEENGWRESVASCDQVDGPLADEACVVSDAGSCHDPDEVNSYHDERDNERADPAYDVPGEEAEEIVHNEPCTESAEEVVNGVFPKESGDAQPEESHWSDCAAEDPPTSERSCIEEVAYPDEPASYSGYPDREEAQPDEIPPAPDEPAVPDEYLAPPNAYHSPPKEYSSPSGMSPAPPVLEMDSAAPVELDSIFDEPLAQEETSPQITAAQCGNALEHLIGGGWKHCPFCSVTALNIQQDGHKL
ncbi:hypothetical protein BFW01_g10231 [Lasiodiplodia theobromae]|uniref:BTB domain-containing protein n=1 Tax=Lasiodiplodia theobromae TaxID=45133 RepID=A0A8H7IMB6_9PEZI|nr:hypothetical protein BFW01_g10231 [Lasiodiplodia theobromae]